MSTRNANRLRAIAPTLSMMGTRGARWEHITVTSDVGVYKQRMHYTPESGVLKVAIAGGLLPYSFMACTDQLYCVLCWRLMRGREVAVMAEKGREVEVLVRVTL